MSHQKCTLHLSIGVVCNFKNGQNYVCSQEFYTLRTSSVPGTMLRTWDLAVNKKKVLVSASLELAVYYEYRFWISGWKLEGWEMGSLWWMGAGNRGTLTSLGNQSSHLWGNNHWIEIWRMNKNDVGENGERSVFQAENSLETQKNMAP